jgi:multiple sugar transport system substrate-binding protein
MTTGHHDFFLAELAASRITGPWEITRADKLKPEGLEYGFSAIPTPGSSAGPVYTYGNPKSIVIFRNSKYPKSAWEFVKYLVSLENDKLLLEMASQIPIRKGLLGIPDLKSYFDKNPKMVAFAGQAQYIRNEDSCVCLKDIFDAISQEFEACVVYRTKTPEQAVHDAAARSALLME